MAGRCGCTGTGGGCSCLIVSSDTIAVTGTGSTGSPFVLEVIGGGLDPESIAAAIAAYLDEHPIGGALWGGLYAQEDVIDTPEEGFGFLAAFVLPSNPIPEGTPVIFTLPTENEGIYDTYRYLRTAVPFDEDEPDPSVFWDEGEQLNVPANLGMLVSGNSAGGIETPVVRIIVAGAAGPAAVPLPVSRTMLTTINTLIATAIADIDLDGFATTAAVEAGLSDLAADIGSEASARIATDALLQGLIDDLESGKLDITAFTAELLKRPQMVAHFSWITDCRHEVNPQIDGRTREPAPDIINMLDKESVLVLRPLNVEYSGIWMGHVNAGYGDPVDPDGDEVWWERPPGVGIPGKFGNGDIDPDTTDPLAPDFLGVNYYEGDMRFPRPPDLDPPEEGYGYGTYYSTLQWSNFIACARKGSYPNVPHFMLEFGGEYSALSMSPVLFRTEPPTLGPLAATHPDTPVGRFSHELWLDQTNETGEALWRWKIDTQEWLPVLTGPEGAGGLDYPAANYTAVVGSSPKFARADHSHPNSSRVGVLWETEGDTTPTLYMGLSPVYVVDMVADTTVTFDDDTVSSDVLAVVRVYVTGLFNITWPATGILWAGGSEPSYVPDSIYEFSSIDGGATWFGRLMSYGHA